jgi:hypothetical protein
VRRMFFNNDKAELGGERLGWMMGLEPTTTGITIVLKQ